MMLHFLAQGPATQPVRWSPSDVVFVVTAIIGAISLTLIPSLIALVKSFKNEGAMQAQSESITRVTNRMNTQDGKINDVAIATGTTPLPPAPPPPPRVQT